MKQIIVRILIIALWVMPAVLAGSFEILRVDHIRMPYGPVSRDFPIRVEVANEGAFHAEGVHIRSWIPFASERATNQIQEISGFNRGKTLIQDADSLPPGEYWVRVTVSNDEERRIKHRLVTIN